MTPNRETKYEGKVVDADTSFGEQTDSLIDLQFLRNIIVKEYKKSGGGVDNEWVTLEKENLAKLVLQAFTDD